MILAPTLLLNAGSGAAIARPTFSRDFAGEKTLNNGTGPAITFTRASNATFFDASGTLQTAANDTPRFDHDPATAGNPSRGLLIEEARTNSIVQSQDFATTWLNTGTTITTDQTTAPDGTSSADLIETTLVNESHSVANAQTWAATTYTMSVFAKYKDHQWLTLRIGVGGNAKFATFDLQNSVVGTATAGVTHSMTAVGNGWYRLVLTSALTTTGTLGALIILNDADDLNNTAYTGTGTGVFLWGAQLEAGAFATSYIPTTTAAATRAADSAVVTPISSFYNQSEGTLFAEWFAVTKTAALAIADFNNGNTTQRIGIITTSSSIPSFAVRNSGTICDIDVGSAIVANSTTKMAGAFAQNDFQAARAGVLGTPDTSGALPEIAVMRFGTNASTSSPAHINGHIRKIAYWPRRLSNTLLEQLTT
jgi:hypothetical protein